MSAREFLLDQRARHPASRLQDLRKALYQSTFGCGHLVDDPSAAADWIRREAEHAPDCREMEPLDGPWCRVPLGILSEGLTPETLAAAFAQSAAMPGEDIPALEDRLAVLMGLIRESILQRRSPPGGRRAFRPATIPRITGTPITRPTGCCISAMPICCRCWRPSTGPWDQSPGCCWPSKGAPPAARAPWQSC